MKKHHIFNSPALLLAPLAGLTHSPFRRLLSEFGGYSALYSEMLAAKPLLKGDITHSTYTRKSLNEGKVVYQIQVNNDDKIEEIIERMIDKIDPWALDLNLGCPAPSARKKRTGAILFEDKVEVQKILSRIKSVWNGPLSVKCRLGSRKRDNWYAHFLDMIKVFEEAEIDWLTVHARFSEDKRKRAVLSSHYQKITESTEIPIIGNGDITTIEQINSYNYSNLSGVMIGRMAVVQPWIFRKLTDPSFNENDIDLYNVWKKLIDYIEEEFKEFRALGRVKQFTSYYCQNFTYGHTLLSKTINATSIKEIKDSGHRFFENCPQRVKSIKILEY